MVKIAITGRQNIRMPNGKLHDDAGLKALDGIITEEYYPRVMMTLSMPKKKETWNTESSNSNASRRRW